MTARTMPLTAKPPKPAGPVRRAVRRKRAAVMRPARPYVAALAVTGAGALFLLAVAPGLLWVSLLAAGAVLGIAADRARMHWGLHRKDGRVAAWKRRRHQGPASWAELRRRAFRSGDAIPICTVTRGRTR